MERGYPGVSDIFRKSRLWTVGRNYNLPIIARLRAEVA
jgi:hypothetical protein